MANTFELASDPVRLAYLEETEGRAGLSRLADYFSNAGEPMPPALQRAVAFSRNVGPSDAAAAGAGFSYENPYALADLAKRAGPAALFEEATALEKAGRPLPAAVAQALMANRSALFSGKKDAATAPFTPAFDFAANLEPETRPVALTPPAATDATEERTPKQTVGSAGVEAAAEKVPPWAFSPSGRSIPSLYGPPPPSIFAPARGARPASVARPAVSSPTPSTTIQGPAPAYTLEETFPPPSYTLEEVPSSSFAPPSYTLEEAPKDPTKTGIPTASAPPTKDSTTPVVSTRPPVTPASPAGKPESMGAPGLPAPSSEGAGGDALSRLGLGQALVRALEGSGSVIAGRDLRSGAAETLGERMRQIEALRAKTEERALELGREDEQSAALVRQYKSLAAQGLVTDIPDIDLLPPKQAAALIKTYASLPGTVARTEKTKAEIPLVQERVEDVRAGARLKGEKAATEEATRGPKVDLLRGKVDLTKAQADKLRQRAVVVKQASDTKAAREIRAAGNDTKAAEKAITRAMETAETDKLGIVGNIRDFQGIETVAPGFTRGVVPSWLGQGGISAARAVPATSKKAAELSSALETFVANIRNSLFGASLTGNEKASFDAIVSSGLLMPPAVLAANINRLRQGAARFAQNHFTVAQELHPEVTGRVLRASSIFGPATSEGGLYSDVWKLPAGPAAGAPAAPSSGVPVTRPPKPADRPGTKTLWNKKRGTWVQYGPEAEAKARADNAVED